MTLSMEGLWGGVEPGTDPLVWKKPDAFLGNPLFQVGSSEGLYMSTKPRAAIQGQAASVSFGQ